MLLTAYAQTNVQPPPTGLDWGALQSGIISLWQSLTGLVQVYWDGAAVPFVATPQVAKAEILAFGLQSVGTLDALSWSELTANGPLVQTMYGTRTITLRTKVTVYSQAPGMTARNFLERLRDRMAWDSTRDALRLLSLGYQSAASLADLSKPIDGRIASIAALDLKFNVGVADQDPTQYSRITSGTFAGNYTK